MSASTVDHHRPADKESVFWRVVTLPLAILASVLGAGLLVGAFVLAASAVVMAAA